MNIAGMPALGERDGRHDHYTGDGPGNGNPQLVILDHGPLSPLVDSGHIDRGQRAPSAPPASTTPEDTSSGPLNGNNEPWRCRAQCARRGPDRREIVPW